jgi:hypothetical protein
MGGPTVSVALREPLTPAEIEDLGAWIGSVASHVYQNGQPKTFGPFTYLAVWKIGIDDGTPICMAAYDCSSSCPVSILIYDPLLERDNDLFSQMLAQLGYAPVRHVGLSAPCNKDIDHRILGHLALLLAERLHGIIDLNGAWYPPMNIDRLWEDPGDWGLWQRPDAPYVHPGPGKVYEFHYTTVNGRPWYSNYADVEAFRARLQQEHFHLIK